MRSAARPLRRRLIVLACWAGLSALADTPAPTQPQDVLEGDRAALESRRLVSERRAQSLDVAAEARRREAAAVHVRIAALAGRVAAGERALRAAESRRHAADDARLLAAARLADERAPLARLLATLVRDARRPAASVLAAPDSLIDDERRRVALAAIRPVIEARSAAVRAALARSDAAAAQAEGALRAVRLAQRDLTSERRSLADAEAGLIDRRSLVLADAATARQQAQGFAEQTAGLDAQIEALRRGARLGARMATLDGPLARPGGPTPAAAHAAAYRLAAAGRVLVGEGELSPAGVRARGLTLAAAPGAIVVAPAAGRVAYAGPFRAWRAIVIVDHGHGWITLVAGLDRATAHVGGLIAQGDAIGQAGARVTIELRHHGVPIDVTGMIEAS